MEREYNWNIILIISLPVALIMAIIFFTNVGIRFKWSFLAIGLIGTYFIVYRQDKKKQNLFTAVAIVLLVSLIAHGLKNLGLF